ncbi:MAG: SRPBCC domain-containing protein [Gammaproteobacteria bacterium]|nr:SRPBCC domain-containing protein [Gammaproteobacteria bacterium]
MLLFALSSGCGTAKNTLAETAATERVPSTPQQHWRVLESMIDVEASPGEVWNDWSTVEGQQEIFAARVILNLQPMGLHEVWFLPDAPAGQRGHENGRIVGWQRQKMLAFTWTMPPYMPMIRPHQTFVQVFFEPLDNERTRIFLYHTGFGTGQEWNEGYDYFAKVWPAVLAGYSEKKTGS